MSLTPSRVLRSLAIGLLIVSCAPDHITGPTLDPSGARFNIAGSSQSVVLSQVYGGGGNAGALYKNDFIEVFNNGSDAVDVTGWSVQYASTAGTSWAKTNLPAGTLAAGHYLLVQEAAGTGGTLPLPTPDATGTIAMAKDAGKVALVRNITLLTCGTAALPCTSSAIADFVGYGTGTTYFEGTGVAPTLANTTADARKVAGCTDSNDNAADFTAVTLTATGSTVPRNSATAANVCGGVVSSVDHITVAPATATIAYHGTQSYTAHVFDVSNVDITAANPVAWSSSATAVATVVSTGTNPATALATGGNTPGDANIIASAGGKSGQGALHMNAPPPPPTVHFSELHYDNSSTDVNEKIEIEGPAGTDLTGWSVVLYGGDATFASYNTTTLGVPIPATCGSTGVVVLSYDVNGIRNALFNGVGFPAGMALVDNANNVVEFLSYEGVFTATDGPAVGTLSSDIGVAEEPPPAPGNSLHRDATGIWHTAAAQDFGVCNGTGGPPPTSTNTISFSGRLTSDPALPVGFEDQLFATEHDGATNATISTSFTWSSDTPGIATIDADGVMRGVSDGSAIFRATATDGTTASYTLPVATNVFSGTADWSGNLEFGVPTDNDPSDDFIITHPQFTSSYSLARNIPNWVSAKLDISHYGANSDRCDCFTFDPAVPANLYYTTNAYTGVGSTWNRGHLLRSADVESATGDNANAYYFSNIAPQSAQMNQVTWAGEEIYLGALAKTGGMDVYEIMGVSGSQGTLKNEGKVTIPAQFWKVAVIVPHGRKLADIHSYTDLTVITVIMPNIANPNSDWNFYKTTVHAVETLSGYNLLSALPDDIELLVESNDRPPTVVMSGPSTGTEGSTLAFDGSGSTDPDAETLTYTWNFNDGGTATGVNPSHTFTDNGTFNVTLTVADPIGATSTATQVVTISNVAPIGTFTTPGPTSEGESFALSLSAVTDPSSIDVAAGFTYRFDCGTGFGSWTSSASANCLATDNPGYSVAGEVRDKDGGVSSYTGTVVVSNVAPSALFSNNAPVNEGTGFTLTLADAIDPGTADVSAGLQYRFDCGSGFGSWTNASSALCPTPDNGTFAVAGEVKDKDGGVSSYTGSASALNVAPTATFSNNGPVNEGGSFNLSLSGPIDPSTADVAAGFQYRFDCGSGFGSWGSAASAVCAANNDGTYNVAGEVRDKDNGVSSYSGSVTVNNVAPAIGAFSGAALLTGETYSANGSFTDPGADSWTATVNYGDGSGTGSLGLSGKSFSLSHEYTAAGSFTVTVTVSDGEVTSTQTATVTVISPSQGIQAAGAAIGQLLSDGKLSSGNANSLQAKLTAAANQIAGGNRTAATNQLQALLNELDALVRSGRLSSADASALRTLVLRVMASLSA